MRSRAVTELLRAETSTPVGRCLGGRPLRLDRTAATSHLAQAAEDEPAFLLRNVRILDRAVRHAAARARRRRRAPQNRGRRYLDFGVGARAILGERRFRRICYAIDNHTFGMTKTDEQDATIDNSERTLTRLLCIADDSARPDKPALADEAMLPGQFALAYEKALQIQADRLMASGRMLSTR